MCNSCIWKRNSTKISYKILYNNNFVDWIFDAVIIPVRNIIFEISWKLSKIKESTVPISKLRDTWEYKKKQYTNILGIVIIFLLNGSNTI